MSLFRAGPSPHQTALAMVGVKPGKTAVVVGAGDGALAAELALITGLNGRTVVIDAREAARGTVEAAAGRAGALVEFEPGQPTRLPVDAGAADVAVLNRLLGGAADRAAVASEAVRVIRPGGRIIVLEGEPRRGLMARLSRPQGPPPLQGAVVCDLLRQAGLRAVRVLADADGVTYVEGVKARD